MKKKANVYYVAMDTMTSLDDYVIVSKWLLIETVASEREYAQKEMRYRGMRRHGNHYVTRILS